MASQPVPISPEVELWRLPTVVARTGLSKTEIYRRMNLGEDPRAGGFPRSRRYKGQGRQSVYWRSDEVNAWRDFQLSDDEFDGLIG